MRWCGVVVEWSEGSEILVCLLLATGRVFVVLGVSRFRSLGWIFIGEYVISGVGGIIYLGQDDLYCFLLEACGGCWKGIRQ